MRSVERMASSRMMDILFALCGREGGEGERVCNDWMNPGLQSKPGFPRLHCAPAAESLGQGSRITDGLAELMGLASQCRPQETKAF